MESRTCLSAFVEPQPEDLLKPTGSKIKIYYTKFININMSS